MVQISGDNFKLIWTMRSGRATKIHPSLPFTLENWRTKGYWEQQEHRKSNFGCYCVTVSYLIHYDSLLQNATVITNCDSFITNCDSTALIPYSTSLRRKLSIKNASCFKASGISTTLCADMTIKYLSKSKETLKFLLNIRIIL